MCARRCSWLYHFFLKKYFIDHVYDFIFIKGTRLISMFCYRIVDIWLLDYNVIGGSVRALERISVQLRKLQTGFLYHYILAMVIGLVAILAVICYGS